MGSTPKNTTTTTTASHPAWLDPYFQGAASEAKDFQKQPFFQGDTYAKYSDQTLQGLQGTENYARNSSLPQDATGYLGASLRGDYLNRNPYADGAFNQAASGITRNFSSVVRPGIDTGFAKAGRLGSNAYGNSLDQSNETLAKQLGGLSNQFYFGNYENERNRQQQALGLAPSVYNFGNANNELLKGVGKSYEDEQNRGIQEQMQRYNYGQTQLDNYISRLRNVSPGSGQSQTSPLYGNQNAQYAGLLLSMLGGLFGGPVGAAAGGAAGAGAGAFGKI